MSCVYQISLWLMNFTLHNNKKINARTVSMRWFLINSDFFHLFHSFEVAKRLDSLSYAYYTNTHVRFEFMKFFSLAIKKRSWKYDIRFKSRRQVSSSASFAIHKMIKGITKRRKKSHFVLFMLEGNWERANENQIYFEVADKR